MFLGVYVDFDNVWGGFLDLLRIAPSKRKQLTAEDKELLLALTKEFTRQLNTPDSDFWYQIHSGKVCGGRYKYKPAFTKLFADFESLPFKENLIQTLQETGVFINYPFVRYKGKSRTKDASDRALILEIVADLFFKSSDLSGIVLVTGDIDYFPVIRFLREYKPGTVIVLCSFNKRLNSFYRDNLQYLDGLVLLDDIVKDIAEKSKEIVSRKLESKDVLYKKFSEKVIKGIKNWFSKKEKAGQTPYVTRSLILESWLPRWGIEITYEMGAAFLDRMVEEGLLVETKCPETKTKSKCYQLSDQNDS